MKGFVREETRFSLCGLQCGLCVMRLGGYCPGCGGGEGNQSCAIARCSLRHGGIAYCSACEAYPCAHFDGEEDYDSFLPRRNRRRDLARAQAMGWEAFLAELDERMDILAWLLENYNDGRRKSFYATAVYLLEIEDLRAVREGLAAAPDGPEQTRRARAEWAAALLRRRAESRGISLRLVQKPPKAREPEK